MRQERAREGIVCEVGSRRIIARRRIAHSGFTLLDLMAAIGIVGVLLALAVPSYERIVSRTNTSTAVADISRIHLAIETYIMHNGFPPPSLAAIGKDTLRDPWGRPYAYLSFERLTGKGAMRKDKNLVPINSDYDLYSVGPDGVSMPPLTAAPSRDDVVMANNGKYIGLAADY